MKSRGTPTWRSRASASPARIMGDRARGSRDMISSTRWVRMALGFMRFIIIFSSSLSFVGKRRLLTGGSGFLLSRRSAPFHGNSAGIL